MRLIFIIFPFVLDVYEKMEPNSDVDNYLSKNRLAVQESSSE